jgi:hypothetical protein
MTHGEAVQDTTTKLGAAAAQLAAARTKRIESAKKIAERDGISLADALLKAWS